MKKYITITIIGLLFATTASAGLWSDFFSRFQPQEPQEEGIQLGSSFSPWYISGTTIKPKVSTWGVELGIATSTNKFSSDTYCINNTSPDCITSWPTGSESDWLTTFSETALTPSSTRGIFITASSTIEADFRVQGNATTTGSMYIGNNLTINNSIATSTITIYSDAVDSGGSIIKEKEDGSGCIEQWSGSDGLEYFSDTICP